MSDTNINKLDPGAVKINGAVIVSNAGRLDVTNLVVKILLYENIMAPFITGQIVLNDATALAENMPLVGEELLVLDIETPGADNVLYRREGVFHLYKMEGRENATMKGNVYTLHFMSIEGFTDMNSTISQTFRGKISDTVKLLISSSTGLNTYKKAIVEQTANLEVHTSNFWSPLQNIYFLANKAVNTNNNPNYVFFEGNEGFIFASLDTLYAGEPIQTFIRDQSTRQGKAPENIDQEYKKILDMSTPEFYDYVDRQQQGYYGSSLYHYDIETKRLNFVARVSKDDFKMVQLNANAAISDNLAFNPLGVLFNQAIHKNLYNDSPAYPIDHHLRRMSLLKRSGALKTTIEVFGRLDYTVGRTCDLLVYSDRSLTANDTEIIDKVMSGRYLITAVTHEIKNKNHSCYLELSKDSMTKTFKA